MSGVNCIIYDLMVGKGRSREAVAETLVDDGGKRKGRGIVGHG